MRNKLKALALLSGGIAVGAMPAQLASADGAPQARAQVTYELNGPLEGGAGDVTLFVHVKKRPGPDKPLYIGAMFANSVDFECDEGPLLNQQFSTQADIPIKSDGRFKYDFASFEAQFKGKVTRQGKRSTGTASFGPNDVSGNTNCVLTGSPVAYTAER